jgi:integrative and conjugative element protein (TIGR02256 family)
MSRRRFIDSDGDLPFQVLFERRVMSIMQAKAQSLWFTRESGGQLFGRIESGNFVVSEVTGLQRTDVRSRTSFTMDVAAANVEIVERFKRGLHFFGDWHTHPEDDPKPSQTDLKNAARLFQAANGRPCFIMVIVGRKNTYVGVHNAKSIARLAEIRPPRNRWL